MDRLRRRGRGRQISFVFAFCLQSAVCNLQFSFALTDTYHQTFDSMPDGQTINAQDSWTVSAGDPNGAEIESGNTQTGTGKALQLTGALTPVKVGRVASYGGVSPTWIEYVVKPGQGAEVRDVPTTGIAAVNFSSTGDILASDGTQWTKTGKKFIPDTWYRIMMKLDFSTHLYNVYTSAASTPKVPFVADKENLHFIDNSIGSMSQMGFAGAYNARSQADSLVDEVVVHTVDKLQFTTSPHTFVKGFPSGLITVQLQNSNSEPQTAWKDITIELSSSTQTGEFSINKDNWVPISSVTLPEGSQQISFYFKDFQIGKPTISADEFPDSGWTKATQEEKVVSEGEFFGIATTTPQVAGAPFDVTLMAKNSEGGPDGGYNGSVDVFLQYVSPTGGSKTIQPDVVTGFVQGSKTISMSYPDTGVVKIVLRDKNDPSKVGYSGEIEFLPDSFSVEAGAVQTIGKMFPVTVKALNKNGEPTPNYQGPAKIEAVAVSPAGSDGQFSHSEFAAGQFQNGTATINTSYNRWGTLTINAHDAAHTEKKGSSGNIKFNPKSIAISVKKASESRDFFYVAENMEITVSILGEEGLPVENYQGTVSLTPSPAFAILSQYVFTAPDKGRKTFVVPAGNAGNYMIKVHDAENGLDAESQKFEVKDATIQISSTSAPVGSTVVEVQLVDSKGKRITSENEMTVTIIFTEEVVNGSLFFSEAGKPVLFKKGVAKIVVGDSEAETVTISAKSPYGLKVQNGKVVFGRPGTSGIGALMLRETKD